MHALRSIAPRLKSKRVVLSVATVALIALTAACDEGRSAGSNWVVTPDVALHRNTGKPLITATGQCGGFADGITRIRKSVEVNVWTINQGTTLIVACAPGYPVGTWGMEERAS